MSNWPKHLTIPSRWPGGGGSGDGWGATAALGLGGFSLGLGLFELLAPEMLKRGLGLSQPPSAAVRAGYGMRELGVGAALLVQPRRPELVWARVAGDVLDLVTLVSGHRGSNPRLGTLRAALASTVAITAVDVAVALQLGRERDREAPRGLRRVFSSLPDWRDLPMIDKDLAKKALPAAAALARKARLDDKRVLAAGGVALALGAGAVAIAALNARKTKGGTSDQPDDKAIERAVTVNKPRAELYRQWRDFTQAPRWMGIVESVAETGEGHHWVVRGPGDKTIEYDTVITEEREGEVLAWVSAPGAKVRSTNRLEFRDAPGGRGTEIHASMTYDPPGGPLGKVAALVTQKAPELQVRRDLRRFKQLMETGEIATTEGPGAAPSSRDKVKQ